MRYALLLLPLLVLSPAAGAAQLPEVPRPARLSVSAYSGVRIPYTTGVVTAVSADSAALFSVSEQRGGNPLVGVEARVAVVGRFSLVAGGAYSDGGISDFFVDRSPGYAATPDVRERYEGATWFARAGVSAHFQEAARPAENRARPATELTAAAGLVRQFATDHPAANIGFQGEFPLGSGAARLVLGLEDYFVFWDRDALAPVMAARLRNLVRDDVVDAQFMYRTSHLLLARAGVALRF